jgi:hypothetical protein
MGRRFGEEYPEHPDAVSAPVPDVCPSTPPDADICPSVDTALLCEGSSTSDAAFFFAPLFLVNASDTVLVPSSTLWVTHSPLLCQLCTFHTDRWVFLPRDRL